MVYTFWAFVSFAVVVGVPASITDRSGFVAFDAAFATGDTTGADAHYLLGSSHFITEVDRRFTQGLIVDM